MQKDLEWGKIYEEGILRSGRKKYDEKEKE